MNAVSPPPPPHKKTQQQQQQQAAKAPEDQQPVGADQGRSGAEARPPAEPPRQQRAPAPAPFRTEQEQEQRLAELRKLKPKRPVEDKSAEAPGAAPAEAAEAPARHQGPSRDAGSSDGASLQEAPRPTPPPLEVGATVAHQALSEEASPASAVVSVAHAPTSTEDERMSSDSEAEFARVAAAVLGAEPAPLLAPDTNGAATEGDGDLEEGERRGLFLQDSFEDELPYVPTTLPQERSVAVPILPVRQRTAAEVRTCPIERPRSTTPINPGLLEEYVQQGSDPSQPPPAERMRIQLPRPVATQPAASTAAEAAPQPPRARSPRSYVDPEECECECHETSGGKGRTHSTSSTAKKKKEKDRDKEREKEKDKERTRDGERARSRSRSHSRTQEPSPTDSKSASAYKEQKELSPTPETQPHTAAVDRLEVTDVADRNSYLSDSSYEFPNSYSVDTSDYSDGLKPMKPFGMDLDVTSNRSSIISQDDTQSPEVGSPDGNEIKHRQ